MTQTTADTSKLKEKIAEREANGGQAPAQRKPDPYRTVQAYLEKMAPEIGKALPKHLSADRLSRITLTTLKLNPALLEAPIESLLGAVMQASQLGLEPNLMGSCYLIPYRDNKNGGRMVVNFQIGFRGLIDLASRSGDLLTIKPNVVHENDEFEYEYGTNERIRHIPASGDRGAITHFYAYAKMKNGSTPFEVMTAADVNIIRDTHASYNGRPSNIWQKNYAAMGKKTVIKQLLKYLPISVELGNAMASDERSFTGLNKDEYLDTSELVDITPEVNAMNQFDE